MSVESEDAARSLPFAAGRAHRSGDAGIILPLALERADGIERVVFRCRIEGSSVSGDAPDALIARIAPAIQRDFENAREGA